MSRLVVENLTLSRLRGEQSKMILDNVSLEVSSNEILILKAPSGSGKTTLLAAIAGLLTPQFGTVTVDGLKIGGLARRALISWRARSIGFIFQRSNLIPSLTCTENVRLAGVLADMDGPAIEAATANLLRELGIDHLSRKRPSDISGGEEQRFAIARALVHSPAVLLADEPTGNLDREASDRVSKLLVSAARVRNAAVMIATHDARLSEIGDRTITIVNGRLAEVVEGA